MAEATSLKDLMIIRAHEPNRKLFEKINGNLGTALGFKKKTGEEVSSQPAIIVFVPQKIDPKWLPAAQIIPKRVDGPNGLWCALDVVEGSKADFEDPVEQDYSEIGIRLRGWDKKIWAGSQVAHWIHQCIGSYSMGTLGAFARKRSDGSVGFITNQHVAQSSGTKLYHPVPWGTHLGTTTYSYEWNLDEYWYGAFADEPDTYVRVDCAFVKLSNSINLQKDINPNLMGVGQMGDVKEISLEDMSIINQKVLRVGRTTGIRRGKVVAFGYEFEDEQNSSYTDLLIIGENGKAFSTKGDSGSLIVTDDEHLNPIGLLWGGWQEKLRKGKGQENWTYGIAISRVLDLLDVEIITTI